MSPSRYKREHELDREAKEFRDLMKVPESFEDGFTWTALFGAVFVALIMVPGAIYMSLIAGASVGPAAQWVTLILFIEVARRAHKTLKRAEVFTLFYLTGAMLSTPFFGVLWNQFYAQSTAAQASGIAHQLPHWFAPTDQEVLSQRSLLAWEWLPAIGLVIFTTIMGRLDNMVLGYGLFRLASDVEKLPFPMAPIGAQGVLALCEDQQDQGQDVSIQEGSAPSDPPAAGGNWRWRVFSIGTMAGLVFGAVYLGLPTISGAILGDPIVLLPIPFVDFTARTGSVLPAVALGLSFDLGMFVLGMVLPFYAMLGSFIGLLVTVIANPVLEHVGILQSWIPGDDLQRTFFKNQIDFYFSFTVGVSLAIAAAGIGAVIRGLRRRRRQSDDSSAVPAGRGDIRTRFIIATYVFTTLAYILVSGWLIDWHRGVMMVMFFYGFLYTPIISYVTARLEGIAGEVVAIPFIREASFILSGYQGVAVWFLPIPLHNYGVATVQYRTAELTGTRFWSIWKAELLLTPIILVGSLLFAHFIWGLAEIPGPQYPYAQEMWELNAEQQSIIYSATLGGYTAFEEAINWKYIVAGFGIGGGMFAMMSWLGAPIFLIYGVVKGLNQTLPFVVIPNFIGALVGRYYFQKRMGLRWRQYTPVVMAGFSCGMGLIATLGVGFTFLARSVFQLPF